MCPPRRNRGAGQKSCPVNRFVSDPEVQMVDPTSLERATGARCSKQHGSKIQLCPAITLHRVEHSVSSNLWNLIFFQSSISPQLRRS